MYGQKGFGPIWDETRRMPLPWGDDLTADWLDSSDSVTVLVNSQNATVGTVVSQTADPDSLLSIYRTLLSLREDHMALRYGHGFTPYENNTSTLQGFYREYSANGTTERLLVLHNFSAEAVALPDVSGTILYLSGTTEYASAESLPGVSTVIIDVSGN
jgi:glycosidase